MLRKFRWLICMVGIVALTGCALVGVLLQPSAYYHYSGYYQCGWTSEGTILASKQVLTEEEMGSDNPRYGVHSIVEIDLQNPSADVEIVSENVRDRNKKKTPGQWCADIELTGCKINSAYKVVSEQWDINGSSDTFLSFYTDNTVTKREAGFEDGVKMKINGEKSKLLVSSYNSWFSIYSIDGEKLLTKTIGGSAIWKNEDTVLFYHKAEGKLAEYTISTDQVKLYSLPVRPEWYSLSENAVYQIDEGYLLQFDLDTSTITYIKKLKYDSEMLSIASFSPDGSKLLLTVEGYFSLTSRSSKNPIYIYNLETDVLTKIRD